MSDLLNQASLVMVPSGYKEDTVYSVVPSDGSGDLALTRASNGTRVNSAGLVEVCPWNLLTYSNTFSNVAWSKNSATITGGQTGYDGSLNASKLEATASDAYIYEGSFSILRTQSIYVKAGSTNKFSVIVGGYGIGMQFDLSNGTIVTNSTPSYFSGSITSVGNGWYYIVVTVQATAPTYGFLIAPQLLNGGGISAGDYVYIQNAQVNEGSTAKPYFPTTDRLNVPRLTYQNGGGGCPSLLLEKQSTNLLTWSEQFDNAAWSKSNVTITANNTTSPDGTQNADLSTATAGGELLQGVVLSTSTSYTFSFYVKKGTASDAKYRVYNFDAGVNVVAPTSYISQTSTSDWVRVVVSFTTGATGTNYGIYLLDQTSAGTMYFYGAQVEASSYPTSYIPTTSSSATRVADACSKTGISSLIGQTEGVLFVDFEFKGYDELAKWIAFLGTGGTYIGLYTDNVFKIVAEVANATSQFISQSFTFSVGTRYKLALAYKANDFAFYVNGTQIATDSSGTVPTTSQFDFNYNTTANNLSSRIYNQVALFPTRLTNAELASLTTI
jgi:hypothetical protein